MGAVRRPIKLHTGRPLLTVLQEPSTGPLLSGAVRRPCCCRPFCVGCRLSAHSPALGDVYSFTPPSKTWVCYSFDFSENGPMSCGVGSVRARKPLLQPTLSGCPFSEKLKGCTLPLLRVPTVGPLTLGAVKGVVPFTVLTALSTSPSPLSGAVRRPCRCRPFCFGCRLPAHSTILGDVHGSTHSASGMPATASLPQNLAFLAATILATTLYSEVSAGQCANVPAGGDFHAQSVCVSGVSDAATSCLKS